MRLTRDGSNTWYNVIDGRTLRDEIDKAVSRFADDAAQSWIDARRRYFLDLTADPRPWWAPVRAANTNGSILLDRYAVLVRAHAIEELGIEFAIALLMVGLTTEQSALFHPKPER